MLSRRCYCCQDSIFILQCNIAFIYRFFLLLFYGRMKTCRKRTIYYTITLIKYQCMHIKISKTFYSLYIPQIQNISVSTPYFETSLASQFNSYVIQSTIFLLINKSGHHQNRFSQINCQRHQAAPVFMFIVIQYGKSFCVFTLTSCTCV